MKIVSFFLVIVLLFSCEEKGSQEQNNTYQILTLLYQNYAKPNDIKFPPPPPDSSNYIFSSKDSARIDSIHKTIEKERRNKKFVVAIFPYFPPYNKPYDNIKLDNCKEYYSILKNLTKKKDSSKINIDKIVINKKDSLIYLDNQLLKDKRKDFYNFDMQISFSNISFNSEYTKAVIVGSFYHSKLAGASMLFFLEKIKGNWIVKCEKGLSIS